LPSNFAPHHKENILLCSIKFLKRYVNYCHYSSVFSYSQSYARLLIDHKEFTREQAVERVSKVPTELSGDPWAHLIWNPSNKKIITVPLNRKAAEELLFSAVGGDLARMRVPKFVIR
jgi:hypothetical protein